MALVALNRANWLTGIRMALDDDVEEKRDAYATLVHWRGSRREVDGVGVQF